MNEPRCVFSTEFNSRVPCGLLGAGKLANHKEGAGILHETENWAERANREPYDEIGNAGCHAERAAVAAIFACSQKPQFKEFLN